jgi:hypothetical protein
MFCVERRTSEEIAARLGLSPDVARGYVQSILVKLGVHSRLEAAGRSYLSYLELVWQRFTDRARRVVVYAQEEARTLNHNHIGTEHVLLGLINKGEGVAARALEAMSISFDSARQRVEEIIGQGQAAPTGHIPSTPRAKKVLELSLREALQLAHNHVGTEHILLALVREGEGVGGPRSCRNSGQASSRFAPPCFSSWPAPRPRPKKRPVVTHFARRPSSRRKPLQRGG